MINWTKYSPLLISFLLTVTATVSGIAIFGAMTLSFAVFGPIGPVAFMLLLCFSIAWFGFYAVLKATK